MTNPVGIKKSEFVQQSSILDSDTFDFVRSGQNFKVPFSTLKSTIGVTGQIKPTGAPTSVAILQQPATTFNLIRGLEPSRGITATISPENGIALKTNLANSLTGIGLIEDPTAAQIKWKGLVAGDGIDLSDDGTSISIRTTTGTATTRTVIVADIDDFPTPVGGVITLEDDTDYFIANNITTTNRFVIGIAATLRGPASQIVKLEYTGTGTMLTGTNPNFRCDRVTLSAPNGKLLDISSPGGGIFQMIETTVESCVDVGDITSMFLVRMKGVAFQAIRS